MKLTTKILMLSAMVVAMASCAKHDFFDDDTITGEVGPEAYWEVGSSAVTAGGNMDFTVQYYSSVSDIDHSEVWYDIEETIDQTVTCPWTSTFTYSLSSNVKQLKRVSQKIEEYPHLEEFWSDSLHAYTFTGSFPVSGTLSPFIWSHPEEFDSTKMINYFGEGYMETFKEAVHAKMKYADYKKMYIGMGLMDDFSLYTDSTLDPNAGVDVYVYHFPLDAEGNMQPWVADSMQLYWDKVTFAMLVENVANGYYDVDYNRSYSLNALMRVYDVRDVYSTTQSKEIVIN
ncbi:MAG: hypothetical protein IJS49_07075 [Paludibacteraceae bacterium]|nr:hypothetical protein [Paludibacteraceae bacterium]